MRIRKRFPSSSFCSLSLTDPQLNRPSPVVQQHTQGSVQTAYPDGNLCVQQGNINSQPSDPPNQPLPPSRLMIGSGWSRWPSYQEVKQQVDMEGSEEVSKQETWGEEEKSTNDTRKESILGAEVGTQILPPSANSSHQEVGRWYEGDKVVPLKKRRGSFERRGSEEITIPEKEKKMKAKMKSKTNKKCVQLQNGSDDEYEGYKEAKEGINNNKTSSAKKSKRGSVIMEGSRCSRVNGRGWRCCQQTLVGYSLCEHHLGKGRLRSINGTTSVRSRAMPKTTDFVVPKKVQSISSVMEYINDDDEEDDEDDDDDDGNEKKPLMMTNKKKKMKLGMVKARSMSSLLGQTNNVVVVADNNKNNRL
ncbi:uncharacterized protein LOC132292953 [Cornus florida]|uniref:uncharacterized protein LOC132292953 n=1 Tax=Cornus florida TaxID=4283 RepID=UPI0028A125C6|nr:uncharacterized protein LOC132292953 [Cornus florida]